eukprot:g13957.t1
MDSDGSDSWWEGSNESDSDDERPIPNWAAVFDDDDDWAAQDFIFGNPAEPTPGTYSSKMEDVNYCTVLLQIVDREHEPTDAPFFTGWKARHLPVATVTSDDPGREHQRPFRIRFRGTDPISKIRDQDTEGRVRLLDASGVGFVLNVNKTTSFPLTIPCALPVAEAENILQESVFGGQEVRLVPLELEAESESEDDEARSDDLMGTADGEVETLRQGLAENQDATNVGNEEGNGQTELRERIEEEDIKSEGGPLVASLVAVDRRTGERRLEVTLVFPLAEANSEVEDEETQNDADDAADRSSSCESSSLSEDEEEDGGAAYTTHGVANRLERALGGEGRQGVGEWIVDLPAAPVVHLQKSGAEYSLAGRARCPGRQEEESEAELAAEQRARLGPLLDAMKSVNRLAPLNKRGDSILRPGLSTATELDIMDAESWSWAQNLDPPYERTAFRGRRLAFAKSLNSREVRITSGGADILQHLNEALLTDKIQAELETGFPVELDFVRLDAGGCCGYVDTLRREKAAERQKQAEEWKARKNKFKKAQQKRKELGRRSLSESSSSDTSSEEGSDVELEVGGARGEQVKPTNEAAGTTLQPGSASSSSSGEADATSSGAIGTEVFKSDDEDAAYDSIARDIVAGQSLATKLSPVANSYSREGRGSRQPKHPKHPGRRADALVGNARADLRFRPRSGRWSTLCTEDDADILRRRDDERDHTVGTLLVSVQGPWTQRDVRTTVRCGCTEKEVTLQILAEIMPRLQLQENGLPEKPGLEPGTDAPRRRVVAWTERRNRYESAIRKEVRREELNRLAGQGFFDTKAIKREEKFRHRKKRWLLGSAPPICSRNYTMTMQDTDRLRKRLGTLLRRAWSSKNFLPCGGTLTLPDYGQLYGARDLHPLRSDSLSKPLRRELPEPGHGRALSLASATGIAKATRQPTPVGDVSATAASCGSAFYCYENVDTYYEPRLVITGKGRKPCRDVRDRDPYFRVRGRDLAFCHQLPPFRWRMRPPEDLEVIGNSAAAAALICGGPLISTAGGDAVPVKGYEKADEISCSSDNSLDRVRATLIREVNRFGDCLLELSGSTRTTQMAAPASSSNSTKEKDKQGDRLWIQSTASGALDRRAKALAGDDYGRAVRAKCEFPTLIVPPQTSALVGAPKKVQDSCVRIRLNLAGVVKLVVPAFESRGIIPVKLKSNAKRSRRVIDELFDIHGKNCETQEEFVAKHESKLRALGRFCRNIYALASDRNPRHRCPAEVRCETLDVLSWFWTNSSGFGSAGKKTGRTRLLKSPVFESTGGGSSEDEARGPPLPRDMLTSLIAFPARQQDSKLMPEFREMSCSSIEKRLKFEDILPASAFSWTLVFPSRGVHPKAHPFRPRDGAASYADRMCAYRSLLLKAGRAAAAASSTRGEGVLPSAAHEGGPLEIVLVHSSSGELPHDFVEVAPLPDLHLVEDAKKAGAVVKIRWYLQELATFPQRDLPGADPATTIGVETPSPGHVLEAAPVRNPFTPEARLHCPVRELAIEFGTEAFRPRRALAVSKPLSSQQLQLFDRDPCRDCNKASSSNPAGNSTQPALALAQQREPLETASERQLELVSKERAKTGFPSQESLREFLFEKVGPQYDCIGTDDIWVSRLPAERDLKWPSEKDLNRAYEKPLEWRKDRWRRLVTKEKRTKPSKEAQSQHKEDWEMRNQLRRRNKVRRAKANLIYFPIANRDKDALVRDREMCRDGLTGPPTPPSDWQRVFLA